MNEIWKEATMSNILVLLKYELIIGVNNMCAYTIVLYK